MKKGLLFLIATTFFAASCSTDNFDETIKPMELKTSTLNKRSYSEALEIANNAISMLGNNDVTRGGFPRQIEKKHGIKYVTNRITRSGTPDTLLYIFNFEGEEGFAVVSANKNTDGLLAVTESGSYDPEKGTDNLGLAMFMNMAEGYVSTHSLIIPEGPTEPIPLLRYKTIRDTTYINIPQRVNLKWGQEGVYARFCPNGSAGCSNVAAAMAMSYYGHPTNITINFGDTISFIQPLNWNNIRNHYYGNSYLFCCDEDTHITIGRLLRQLGKLSNSDYTEHKRTSTTTSAIRSALINLGYTASSIYNYSQQDVCSDLNQGKLIMMSGSESSGANGHMWLIDGCYELTISEQECVSSDGITWEPVSDATVTSTRYNHINWGWDGKNNGLFNEYVFNTMAYRELDSGCYAEVMNNYQADLECFSIHHQ